MRTPVKPTINAHTAAQDITGRRRCLITLASLLLSGKSALAAATPRKPMRATTLARALLDAEQALAEGHALKAAELFEHASHVEGESATAEIGMVRAYMASAQFRKALSFAHLVAGEHTQSREAMAWVALLSDRSGQTAIALGMLDKARTEFPDDVALLCAQSEILTDRSQAARAVIELDAWLQRNRPQAPVLAQRYRVAQATGDMAGQGVWRTLAQAAFLREGDARQAAHFSTSLVQTTKAVSARLAQRDAEIAGTWILPGFAPIAQNASTASSSGLLCNEGRSVITTTADWRTKSVRSAQGQIVRVISETTLADGALRRLELERALPFDDHSTTTLAARSFPGSSYHAIGYPLAGSTLPCWPMTSTGFLGMPQTQGTTRALALGQTVPPGLHGAPVFNASAQLCGFVHIAENLTSLLPATALRDMPYMKTASEIGARVSEAEIYERALACVVLVVSD